MRRPTLVLGSALLALAALSGCGDTDETPTEASALAGGDAGTEASGDCKTVTVDIPEFAFAPDPVEIAACDSVVWENTHDQAHTATGKGDKTWNTANIAAGEGSEPVLFDEAGSFEYICALHPFMKGTVEVS